MSEIHFRDRGWEGGTEQEEVSRLAVGAAPVAFGPPLVHTACHAKAVLFVLDFGIPFYEPPTQHHEEELLRQRWDISWSFLSHSSSSELWSATISQDSGWWQEKSPG